MISDEEKREIKQFIEAHSVQWTDFVSLLDETLGLYSKPVRMPPLSFEEVNARLGRPTPHKSKGGIE